MMFTERLARVATLLILTHGAMSWGESFDSAVVNLEYSVRELGPQAPYQILAAPAQSGAGEAWYGVIPRRFPGQSSRETEHYVPFVASYQGGIAVRAWCDTNLNGDLTDDPEMRLSTFPHVEEGRSFLADLRWSARVDSKKIPIDWKIRVVLEPRRDEAAPRYRLQRVFGMLGAVTLLGKRHRAVLYDGDSDGLYRNAFPDGMFVDGDDDRHFTIDPMSPDFAPFGVPFQRGDRIYEIAVTDPAGSRLALRELATAEPIVHARVGEAAPPFSFVDTTGAPRRLTDYRDRVVLIYFWSSGCGSCRFQAASLRQLAERYRGADLEILGISYDTDRAAMEGFRREHGHDWPNEYTGLRFWENPIGRQYRAGGSGMIYLVSPAGRLDGIYSDVDEVEARIREYLVSFDGWRKPDDDDGSALDRNRRPDRGAARHAARR